MYKYLIFIMCKFVILKNRFTFNNRRSFNEPAAPRDCIYVKIFVVVNKV